jgi:hypothetical protein
LAASILWGFLQQSQGMLIGIAEKGYPQIALSLSGIEMWRAGQAQPALF